MTEENKRKIKNYLRKKEIFNNNNINSQQQSSPTLDSFFSNIQTTQINNNTIYQIDEISPENQEINKNSKNFTITTFHNNKKENQKKLGNEVKKFDYI